MGYFLYFALSFLNNFSECCENDKFINVGFTFEIM